MMKKVKYRRRIIESSLKIDKKRRTNEIDGITYHPIGTAANYAEVEPREDQENIFDCGRSD